MKKLSLLGIVLVLVGCVSSIRTATPTAAAPAASATAQPAGVQCCRDTHEALDGLLWMQTAAEYRMLTETTYRAASEALPAALADTRWTAATEQTDDPSALPPAIVLDLDETVMDNSRFEGELVLRRIPYSQAVWDEWVAMEAAGLVPGAKPFLDLARERGVAIYFVTNRTLAEEAHTIANLAALGIPTTPENVMCARENNWTSDKTARRTLIASSHRIIMLFGDDLGDFIPSKLSPEQRVAASEKHKDWWGKRWFVLPNPTYGSWERALYNHESGLSDRETLQRKLARARALHN